MAIKTNTFTSGGGGGGAVDSVNGQTGVVVVSGNDLAADHTASNYTAANANIDGHLSGIDTKLGTLVSGMTYQGGYDATSNLPSLANTSKGDFYIITTAGTRFGRDWAVGDHLVINEDMGGVVSNGKIDKIDNTDAVASVNSLTGVVVVSGDDIVADHTASNYTATNANIDGHLSGIDTKLGTLLSDITAERIGFLSDVTITSVSNGDLLSYSAGEWKNNASTSDFLASTAGLDDLSDVAYTPGSGIDNYVLTYDHSTTSWGAEAAGSAPVTSVNTLTGAVVVSGDDLVADHSASNYTATNANIDGHLSGIDTKFGTLGTASVEDVGTTAGDLVQLDGTAKLPAVDGSQLTNLPSAPVTSVNTLTGAVVVSGDDVAADHSASNYTAANANIDGHLSGIDSKFGTLGTASTAASSDFLTVSNNLSDLNNVGTARTNLGLGTSATLDTGTSNGNVVVLDATGLPAVDGSQLTGVVSTDTSKLAIANNLSDLNNVATARTNLGLGTAATSANTDFLASTAALDDLSDVAYIPSAGIDNYVLTYDHSTTSWGAEAAASGGLSEVVQDTTPQLGGDLDVNGNSITSAGNANVLINPAGTGDISIGADLIPDADATHKIGDEDNRFVSTYSDLNGAIRFKAKNAQGAQITKGQAVYISGVSGTVPEVQLARANSASTMPAFGLVHATANAGADVEIVTFGNLTDYNTTTYSLSANDTVFISAATAGALTNTAPTGETNFIQNIGRVVRADVSAGIIKAGGAGRSNATPNLDDGKIFLGNGSNQAVSTALSAIALSSLNDDLNYISNVVDDTTPQLGGSLDVNGQDIVSVSNGDIEVDPNGTGSFKIKGNATSGSGRLVLNCEQNSHGITLKGPPHSAAASYTLTFPNTDGTADQVLKTDGSGGLDWVDQSGGGGAPSVTTDSSGSDTTISTTTGISEVHLISNAANNVVITLPAAATAGAGYRYEIKRLGTGSVTIDPNGSEYIDHSGQTTFAIGAQYDSVSLVTDGSQWFLI